MITTKKTAASAAGAVGGKTARACDSCLRSRARWYCPADDAFLCQGCDSLVHSANQLASRHERVRLETASNHKPTLELSLLSPSPPPSWHRGFTRKARTPRPAPAPRPTNPDHQKSFVANPLCLVPEIGSEEGSSTPDLNEEQLLYMVPVFDPFSTEEPQSLFDDEQNNNGIELENVNGFLATSSDLDLNDFAADVESLLGIGLDEDSCGIEGLLDCKEEEEDICIYNDNDNDNDGDGDGDDENMRVKIEDEEGGGGGDGFDWNFDYESPPMMMMMTTTTTTAAAGEEELEEMKVEEGKEELSRKIFLRLNYEEVIREWSSKGCCSSPWTTGIKPEQFNPSSTDLSFPDFMVTSSSSNGTFGTEGGRRIGDGGREARVLRYREKRRTRLFSKKIRYEVRKLNAEKRPRMKGRFVKRTTSFAGGLDFPHFLINK